MAKPLTDLQERWLGALESGQYKQGHGRLRDSANQYCCLGVLCEVAGLTPSQGFENNYNYENESFYAPKAFALEAGLKDHLGTFVCSVPKTRPDGVRVTVTSLACANDEGCWTFADIVKFIRENPEQVFNQDEPES